MDTPIKNHRTTLTSFLILLILTIGLTLFMVYPYLLSIIMGAILSLMLRPFYDRLRAKDWGKKTTSLILTVGVILLFLVPLSLLAVLAVKQAVMIGRTISEDENFSTHAILMKVSQWGPFNALFDDPASFEAKASEWLEGVAKTVSGGLLVAASMIPVILLQLILAAISCFVFLLEGGRFTTWMSDKIPLEFEVRKKLSKSFRDTAVSTIWATLAGSAAQSVVMFTAFLVLGMPALFLATGLTFLFAWIPMVGCSPVWGVASIYLFSQGHAVKGIIMILFGLGAGIMDNIVRPAVLKGRSKMHPLVSLISIFGGIGLFGVVGVFIGPVLSSLLIAMLSLWSEIGDRYGLIPKIGQSK